MTTCFHCQEGCDNSIVCVLDQQPRAFCCVGCKTVAEMIFAQGLQSYYQHRSKAAHKANLIPEQWLSSASEQHIATAENGLSSVTFFIEAINCAACAWLIERRLRQVPGVHLVSTNITARRTLVEWDSQKTPLADLLQHLQQIGYRALPYSQDTVETTLENQNTALLKRLAVAAFGMMQAMMYTFGLYFGMVSDLSDHDAQWLRWAGLLCTLPVVVYSATPFYRNAWRALLQRSANMDLSVSLGIISAFVVSAINTVYGEGHVYFDSVAMFAFLLLASRYIENRMRDKANKSSALQQRLLPSKVSCWRDHQWQVMDLSLIKIGDKIRVSSGEVIAVDGEIVAGSGAVDERIISGESIPVAKSIGATVLAGSLVQGGSLELRVNAEGQQTYLSQLSRLQDQALAQRPLWQQAADRVAHYFVLAVIMVATLAYLFWRQHHPAQAFDILLAVLVVTCPCALSLALPTAWAASTHHLIKKGFLIRRAQTLTALAQLKTVVLDKTGTLTAGKFEIAGVQINSDLSESRLLKIAAALEQHSKHPIARAFDPFSDSSVVAHDVIEKSGIGLHGIIEGKSYFIGRLEGLAAHLRPSTDNAQFYFADEQQILAQFDLHDQLRTDAQHFVRRLQQLGYDVIIASGDRLDNVKACAETLNIKRFYARLLPEQKLHLVRELQAQGQQVLMIGDGINDAPVLAGADASIAVGDGVDFARRAADAVLNRHTLSTIIDALRLSHRTRDIVRQNIVWAIIYNVLALPSALFGWLSPWEAALGMSLSSLLVTFNSLRLQSTPDTSHDTPFSPVRVSS